MYIKCSSFWHPSHANFTYQRKQPQWYQFCSRILYHYILFTQMQRRWEPLHCLMVSVNMLHRYSITGEPHNGTTAAHWKWCMISALNTEKQAKTTGPGVGKPLWNIQDRVISKSTWICYYIETLTVIYCEINNQFCKCKCRYVVLYELNWFVM